MPHASCLLLLLLSKTLFVEFWFFANKLKVNAIGMDPVDIEQLNGSLEVQAGDVLKCKFVHRKRHFDGKIGFYNTDSRNMAFGAQQLYHSLWCNNNNNSSSSNIIGNSNSINGNTWIYSFSSNHILSLFLSPSLSLSLSFFLSLSFSLSFFLSHADCFPNCHRRTKATCSNKFTNSFDKLHYLFLSLFLSFWYAHACTIQILTAHSTLSLFLSQLLL